MGSPLWDADETDANKQRSLSDGEQQFLLTGDPGTENISKIEERISRKATMLPSRVQQLIDDISLLYQGGYLEDGTDEMWDDLLSVSGRSQRVRESEITRKTHSQSDTESNFGFEIGSMIRFLHNEEVPDDLIWGFIIALVGEPDKRWGQEGENLSELLGYIEERGQNRLVSAGVIGYTGDGRQQEYNEIREILREQGYTNAPPLVSGIKREYEGDGNLPKQSEYPATKTTLSSDSLDRDDHPEPPDDFPSPEEMYQTQIESILSRFEDHTPLASVDRLAERAREDVNHIQNKEIWGVDCDAIFSYLGENGETHVQNTDEINATRHSKTHVLKILASEESSVVSRPVTTKRAKATWSLSPYGELLYEIRTERDCSTDWLYYHAVDADRIDNEMSSLISRVIESESER